MDFLETQVRDLLLCWNQVCVNFYSITGLRDTVCLARLESRSPITIEGNIT